MTKKICYMCNKCKLELFNTFTFAECMKDGDGLVYMYVCPNCGAWYEISVNDFGVDENYEDN